MKNIAPYRVVTLLELLEHNAEAFCRLSSLMGQLMVGLRVNFRGTLDGVASLGELQREAQRLGLSTTTKQLQRIYDSIESGTPPETISKLVEEAYLRLLDEIEERIFVAIPSEMTDVYRQSEPPFGISAENAFPLATGDISEAAKCLALGRSTASVFHLMRAMEIAVQALSAKLGVTKVEKEWGKLLSDITSAIESMPKGSARDEWSEARTHLYHVKQAWRNNTMHPKQTYTLEEAQAIYDAVRVFMTDLASLVS